MAQEASVPADRSVQLTADITAQILLGKIRLPNRQGEPHYILPARMLFNRLRQAIGEEKFEQLMGSWVDTVHVLVDALFDAVTGVSSAKTKEGLKKLPVPQRLMVEQIVMHATGRAEKGGPQRPRWNDELWQAKGFIEMAVNTSISGLTAEDIRTGYDPLIHAVVDEIYKHRNALVN